MRLWDVRKNGRMDDGFVAALTNGVSETMVNDGLYMTRPLL